MVSERKTTLLWDISSAAIFLLLFRRIFGVPFYSCSSVVYVSVFHVAYLCPTVFLASSHMCLVDREVLVKNPDRFFFTLCFFLISLCVAYIKRKCEPKFLSHSVNCNELHSTTQQRQADCSIFRPERSSQIAFVKQCKCAGRACNTLAWCTPSTGNRSILLIWSFLKEVK